MSKIKIIISCVFIICVTVFAVKFFKNTTKKTSSSTLQNNTLTILYQATRLGSTMKNSCTYAPYGGLLREINASKAIRSHLPGGILYVDAGNSLIPFNRDKGASNIPGKKEIEVAGWIAKELAEAKLDVLGIGQVDLNLSIPTLKKIQQESALKFISSNVKDKKGKYPFPRYIIQESSGVNFGILSVTSSQYVQDKNVVIEDPKSAILELVPKLKNEGANFIVLLSQMSADSASSIVTSLPEDLRIDVVISSDLFFSTSRIFWLKQGTSLLANQDFFGAYLGKLQVKYNSLPISLFSSTKQIQANKDRIKQLETILPKTKNQVFVKKELDYLKTHSQLDVPENAASYDGGLIGLDSSFDSVETINLENIKIINN